MTNRVMTKPMDAISVISHFYLVGKSNEEGMVEIASPLPYVIYELIERFGGKSEGHSHIENIIDEETRRRSFDIRTTYRFPDGSSFRLRQYFERLPQKDIEKEVFYVGF